MIFRPKHQRLVLIVIALVAVAAAVLLAMWGLRDRAGPVPRRKRSCRRGTAVE
jgi:hypothetical protein